MTAEESSNVVERLWDVYKYLERYHRTEGRKKMDRIELKEKMGSIIFGIGTIMGKLREENSEEHHSGTEN